MREAKPSRSAVDQPQRAAAPTDDEQRQAARARRLDDARRDVAVAVDHRRRAGGQQLAEQPQLGVEVDFRRHVIVEVVARQVGEGAGGQPHAVEPLLVEAVRGGFERQVGDAGARQLVERLMQRDRIGRRQRAVDFERPRDDAERAERGRLAAGRRPDLPREGGDRGLAAGAGDGDDAIGLTRIEARRGVGQRRARVGDLDERRVARRRAFADDRRRALGERVGDEGEAVLLGPGSAKKASPGRTLRLSAVRPPMARSANSAWPAPRSRISPSLVTLCLSGRRRRRAPVAPGSGTADRGNGRPAARPRAVRPA